MSSSVENLVEEYVAWVRDNTKLRRVNRDWTEITTPYLDRHNDFLQIYVREEGGTYTLTDDSYVIQDLEQSGCALDSPKRKDLLQMTLNGFGVHLEGDALTVRCTATNFSLRKHLLVQAMLAVGDLFYLAAPSSGSLFYEDVEKWLDFHDIRYTPKVKIAGRTGYDHVFDFIIPKSRTRPERMLKAVTNPSRETAQSFVLAWIDTRGMRPADAAAYALLNDNESRIPGGVIEALESYEVRPVAWSDRERIVPELAA